MKLHRSIFRRIAAAVTAVGLLMPAAGPTMAQSETAPVVAIDAGHQRKANMELEPVGPGANEKKMKVAGGATGVATKKPEYILTLEVSQLVQKKLTDLGYRVLMTREANEVDISNKKRAELANEANAELFVRIHADGDTSAATKGISVLYPSASNPYTAAIYEDSKRAAEEMLAALVKETGARSRGAVPRDDLSGFNWSKVPTVLVEMGFMSNPDEDKRMSEPAYQEKLADGMVEGVVAYLAAKGRALQPEAADETMTLLAQTELYGKEGVRYVKTGVLLSPQQVRVFEKLGRWAHIRTWLGDRWVPTERALSGEVIRKDGQYELTGTTPFYAWPSADSAPLGELAPQKVDMIAAWRGWLCVRTWLGESWIRTE
ncbi:N-acetylmuramoyl-L-alanine amidase [Paenibacillus sp. MBLB4367]|uniref:N-acetylmuramoyl-L-alanine amidase family protein n=1 Tax=Paenibacillus sp. MBLB4367 TaxID=3384767 RepID=UPI003907E856